MSSPTLSLCMIVRNNERTIRDCLLSVLERPSGPMVDEIVLVDTGSTDGTLDVVAQLDQEWPEIDFLVAKAGPSEQPDWFAAGGVCSECGGAGEVGPDDHQCGRCAGTGVHPDDGAPVLTNFAAARQLSFELASGDWRGWLDSDDVILQPDEVADRLQRCRIVDDAPDQLPRRTLRDVLGELQHNGVNTVMAPYHYAVDTEGRPVIRINHIRWVRWEALSWRWRGRIHETLAPTYGKTQLTVLPEMVYEQRLPNDTNRVGRNLVVLRTIIREGAGEDEHRSLLYLADFFSKTGERRHLGRAIKLAKAAYLAADNVGDRYMAAHGLANVYRADWLFAEAKAWDLEATTLIQRAPDAYLGLFQTHYEMQDWQTALNWFDVAERTPTPDTFAFVSPMDRLAARRLALRLASELGDHTRARRYYEALRKEGEVTDDEHVLGVRAALALDHRQTSAAVQHAARILVAHEEPLKALQLLDAAPSFLDGDEHLQRLRVETWRQVRHALDTEEYAEAYHVQPGSVIVDDEYIEQPQIDVVRGRYIEWRVRELAPRTVLEIGTACGWMSTRLALHQPNIELVVGVDMTPNMVQAANNRAQRLGLDHELHYYEGASPGWDPTLDTPADDEVPAQFDVVILADTLEHVEDPAQTLAHAVRLVGPGGHLLVSVPSGAFEPGQRQVDLGHFAGHVRAWSRRRILDLVRECPVPLDVIDFRDHVKEHPSTWDVFTEYMMLDLRPARIHHVQPALRWAPPSDRRVIIYSPESMEDWVPGDEDRKGLGGSETAVIKVAAGLARKGWDVTVFNQCGDRGGVYDGVEYAPHGEYDPRMACHAFIAFRTAVDPHWLPRCAKNAAWFQDMNIREALTPARARALDAIWTLSPAHEDHLLHYYPFLLDFSLDTERDGFVMVPNGLDPTRFDENLHGEVERDPRRIIWLSSWDRGLETALKILRRVLERGQVAPEMLVYYGTVAMDRAVRHQPLFWARNDMLKQRIRKAAEGLPVVFYDRIPQHELATRIREANIWLYPLEMVVESGCIAATETMAGGALPICSNQDALADWCPSVIDNPVHTAVSLDGVTGIDRYVDRIERIILGAQSEDQGLEAYREALMGWARRVFDWQHSIDRAHAWLAGESLPPVPALENGRCF